jgi:hypothetical protein
VERRPSLGYFPDVSDNAGCGLPLGSNDRLSLKTYMVMANYADPEEPAMVHAFPVRLIVTVSRLPPRSFVPLAAIVPFAH